jgi:hypothetical protein
VTWGWGWNSVVEHLPACARSCGNPQYHTHTQKDTKWLAWGHAAEGRRWCIEDQDLSSVESSRPGPPSNSASCRMLMERVVLPDHGQHGGNRRWLKTYCEWLTHLLFEDNTFGCFFLLSWMYKIQINAHKNSPLRVKYNKMFQWYLCVSYLM